MHRCSHRFTVSKPVHGANISTLNNTFRSTLNDTFESTNTPAITSPFESSLFFDPSIY